MLDILSTTVLHARPPNPDDITHCLWIGPCKGCFAWLHFRHHIPMTAQISLNFANFQLEYHLHQCSSERSCHLTMSRPSSMLRLFSPAGVVIVCGLRSPYHSSSCSICAAVLEFRSQGVPVHLPSLVVPGLCSSSRVTYSIFAFSCLG